MTRFLLTLTATLMLALSLPLAGWAEEPAPAATPAVVAETPAPAAEADAEKAKADAEAAAALIVAMDTAKADAIANLAAAEIDGAPAVGEAKAKATVEAALAKNPNAAINIKTAASWATVSGVNAGDNAWMMISCALVLMMTGPGLALFYGGLVRKKNILGTMMQSFALMAVVTLIWCTFGFAIAFGGANAYWGGFDEFVMLKGVVLDAAIAATDGRYPVNGNYAGSISFAVFCMFQLTFAIITPALISGAYAERLKFTGMLLFTVLWLVFIYLPLAHMVWGNAGLFNWGFGANAWAAFDFAGGTVVHISSGIAALVFAVLLKKRKGYPAEPMPPHSLVLSFIGACLLWVGWFGFNGGSALGASGLAALAFMNTQIAAASAVIGWAGAEWIIKGKPTVLGGISGAVAGLVGITPAAGFVDPGSAIIIGLVAGVLCFTSAVYVKSALKYDDSLDAFGVHGVGGMWGAVATGIFFNPDANACLAALNSSLYLQIVAGEHNVILGQIKAVLFTVVLSGVGSTIIFYICKFTTGLEMSDEEQDVGMDLTLHGEEGYHGA